MNRRTYLWQNESILFRTLQLSTRFSRRTCSFRLCTWREDYSILSSTPSCRQVRPQIWVKVSSCEKGRIRRFCPRFPLHHFRSAPQIGERQQRFLLTCPLAKSCILLGWKSFTYWSDLPFLVARERAIERTRRLFLSLAEYLNPDACQWSASRPGLTGIRCVPVSRTISISLICSRQL